MSDLKLSAGIDTPIYKYKKSDFDTWKAARIQWNTEGRTNPDIWGDFSYMALCDRFSFNRRAGQNSYQFGEAIVAYKLETEHNYICWTTAKIIRKIDRQIHKNPQKDNTKIVEGLLQLTLGKTPQEAYIDQFSIDGQNLKCPDIVGFNFRGFRILCG